jgi:hypothetical protein
MSALTPNVQATLDRLTDPVATALAEADRALEFAGSLLVDKSEIEGLTSEQAMDLSLAYGELSDARDRIGEVLRSLDAPL